MGWLSRWLRRAPSLAAVEARWVVADCESSGLDPRNDRLLSIGAVALEGCRIALDSGYSVVLKQERASAADNIVIHGIAGGEQLQGIEAAAAFSSFETYVAGATLVGFHAHFDRTLMERCATANGCRFKHAWLDLAALAPALHPDRAARCKALDDWLAAFGIESVERHDALGDAYATAQLFQVLLHDAQQQGVRSREDLLAAAEGQRWLGRSG